MRFYYTDKNESSLIDECLVPRNTLYLKLRFAFYRILYRVWRKFSV